MQNITILIRDFSDCEFAFSVLGERRFRVLVREGRLVLKWNGAILRCLVFVTEREMRDDLVDSFMDGV